MFSWCKYYEILHETLLTRPADWRGSPTSGPAAAGTPPPPPHSSRTPRPSCSASRSRPAMSSLRNIPPHTSPVRPTSPKQYKTFCLLNPSALPAQKQVPWQTVNIVTALLWLRSLQPLGGGRGPLTGRAGGLQEIELSVILLNIIHHGPAKGKKSSFTVSSVMCNNQVSRPAEILQYQARTVSQPLIWSPDSHLSVEEDNHIQEI